MMRSLGTKLFIILTTELYQRCSAKIAFDLEKFPNADYTSDLYSVQGGEVTFKEGTVDKRRIESAQMRWVREIEDIFGEVNV